MIKRAMFSAAVIGLTTAAHAGTTVIDFETDPAGPRPNGFFSLNSPLVTFTDSEGADLLIDNFGIRSIGQGLAVGTDLDGSILIMDFSVTVDSLSMDIGNDDPLFTSPGDYALLTVYLDGNEVGTTLVELNGNSAMDQNIAFSGEFFNSASIEYYVSGDGATEIVDNITFHPVPVPGALAPLAMLLTSPMTRRRRHC